MFSKIFTTISVTAAALLFSGYAMKQITAKTREHMDGRATRRGTRGRGRRIRRKRITRGRLNSLDVRAAQLFRRARDVTDYDYIRLRLHQYLGTEGVEVYYDDHEEQLLPGSMVTTTDQPIPYQPNARTLDGSPCLAKFNRKDLTVAEQDLLVEDALEYALSLDSLEEESCRQYDSRVGILFYRSINLGRIPSTFQLWWWDLESSLRQLVGLGAGLPTRQ